MQQLSKHAQLRWFADWFAGRTVRAYPTEAFFSGAYRYVHEGLAARRQLPPRATGEEVWHVLADFSRPLNSIFSPDGADLYELLRGLVDPDRHFPNLLELAETLPPIEWAWKGWLPVGMLSMLAARPGTGKSLVALDLCRRIINGEPWPDGSVQTRAGAPCIYVDAENIPNILNERAAQWETWGLDRRRIYPVVPGDDEEVFNLGAEQHRDLLNLMALRIQPGLIVVDSLRDILPGGESNVEDVRSTLAFLSGLARGNNCALLLVHHMRKRSNSSQLALIDSVDIDDISGSGYIGGRARVVLGLTRIQTGEEFDKNGPRKIEVAKTTLGEYPKDMGITFEKTPPEGIRLAWTANAPKRYTDEPDTGPTIRDVAKDWLLTYLETADEPVPPKQVETDAQEAGISRATLFRARSELEGQIVNSRGRKAAGNGWMLASAACSPDADA